MTTDAAALRRLAGAAKNTTGDCVVSGERLGALLDELAALRECVRAADVMLDPGGTKAAVSAYKAARAKVRMT